MTDATRARIEITIAQLVAGGQRVSRRTVATAMRERDGSAARNDDIVAVLRDRIGAPQKRGVARVVPEVALGGPEVVPKVALGGPEVVPEVVPEVALGGPEVVPEVVPEVALGGPEVVPKVALGGPEVVPEVVPEVALKIASACPGAEEVSYKTDMDSANATSMSGAATSATPAGSVPAPALFPDFLDSKSRRSKNAAVDSGPWALAAFVYDLSIAKKLRAPVKPENAESIRRTDILRDAKFAKELLTRYDLDEIHTRARSLAYLFAEGRRKGSLTCQKLLSAWNDSDVVVDDDYPPDVIDVLPAHILAEALRRDSIRADEMSAKIAAAMERDRIWAQMQSSGASCA